MSSRYEDPAIVTAPDTGRDEPTRRRLRLTRHVLVTLAVTFAIGGLAIGCGGEDVEEGVNQIQSTAQDGLDSATGAGDEGEIIDIPADPAKLAFAATTANAKAGTVTLRMENPSEIPHNIALQNPDRKGEIVGRGGVSEVKIDLPAGTYTYYCTVPGHLEGGMKGTLVVE